jgi:hypothetical protein
MTQKRTRTRPQEAPCPPRLEWREDEPPASHKSQWEAGGRVAEAVLAELWDRLPRAWSRLLHEQGLCIYLRQKHEDRGRQRIFGWSLGLSDQPPDLRCSLQLYDGSDEWRAGLQALLAQGLVAAVLESGAPRLWEDREGTTRIKLELERALLRALGFPAMYARYIMCDPAEDARHNQSPESSPTESLM